MPEHDWSSHGCDAGEIMARMYRDRVVTQKDIEGRAIERLFYKHRRSNKLDSTDPYRVKKVRGRV